MNNEIMEIPEINTGFVGRLIPTEEQKRLLNVNLNIARNAYNYARWKNLEEYKEANRLIDEYRKTLVEQKLSEDKIKELCDKYQKSVYKDLISSPYKLSVLYTAEVNSNPEKYKWMKEGDSFARCYCFSTSYRDAMRKFYANLDKMKANVAKKREKAKKRKDEGGKGKVYKFPKDYGFAQYKLKADSYNTELSINALDYENNKVRLCKIGWVQVTKNQPLPKYDFPTDKASNPRVIFDGIHYYISFSFHKDVEPFNTEKTDVIGVDLGLKNIAVLSTGEVIKNPANDERIIRLEERKKKFQIVQ